VSPERLPGVDFPEFAGLRIAKGKGISEEAVAYVILLIRAAVGQVFRELRRKWLGSRFILHLGPLLTICG